MKSKLDKLNELGELLKSGTISQEEFNNLKNELLRPQTESPENQKIVELNELLKSGTISQEEFDKLKVEYIKNSSEKLIDDKQESYSSKPTKAKSDSEVSFKQKTYHFNTGVNVNVNQETVVIKDDVGSASIDRRNLDNFSYQAVWESRFSPAGLIFRFNGISAVIAIASEMIFGAWSSESFGLTFILIIVNVIVWGLFTIDAMLQLNISQNIIKNYFSNQAYSVSIGNKSGNNLDFFAPLDEKSKIVDLERRLDNLKKL